MINIEESSQVKKTHLTIKGTRRDLEMSNWYWNNPETDSATIIAVIKARNDNWMNAENAINNKIKGYKNKGCLACGAEKESTEHILMECEKYTHVRKELQDKIIRLINNGTKTNSRKTIENSVPIWFMITEQLEDKYWGDEQRELHTFDKLAGALGIIPSGLKKVIRNLLKDTSKNKGKKEKNKIRAKQIQMIRKIHMAICENIPRIWKERNREIKRKINELSKKQREEENDENKKGEESNPPGEQEENYLPLTPPQEAMEESQTEEVKSDDEEENKKDEIENKEEKNETDTQNDGTPIGAPLTMQDPPPSKERVKEKENKGKNEKRKKKRKKKEEDSNDEREEKRNNIPNKKAKKGGKEGESKEKGEKRKQNQLKQPKKKKRKKDN